MWAQTSPKNKFSKLCADHGWPARERLRIILASKYTVGRTHTCRYRHGRVHGLLLSGTLPLTGSRWQRFQLPWGILLLPLYLWGTLSSPICCLMYPIWWCALDDGPIEGNLLMCDQVCTIHDGGDELLEGAILNVHHQFIIKLIWKQNLAASMTIILIYNFIFI